MYKQELTVVIDGIKSLEAKSREIQDKIRAAHGIERHNLRMEKRNLGFETRGLLQAYAFLRGVPRSIIEPVTDRLNNPGPSARYIFSAIKRHFLDARQELETDVGLWLSGEFSGQPEVFAPVLDSVESDPSPIKKDSEAGFFSVIGRAIRSAVGST